LAVSVNNSGGTLQGGTGGGVLTLDGHTVSLGILTGQFGGINGATLNNVQLGGSSADVVTLTDRSTFGIRNTVGLTVTNLGTLNLGNGGAGVTLNSLLTLQLIGGQLIFTPGTLQNGDGTFADRFATIQGGGTLNVPVISNGIIIANNASMPLVIARDVTDPNGLSVLRAIDGGTLTIDPATVNGQLLSIDHGSTLNGIGTIHVNDNVGNAGVVAPGLGAPGTLTIDGTYTQTSNFTSGTGVLDFLLGGGQAGQYSVLDVTEFALFDTGSIIEAEFFNGFDPSADCGPTFGVCDSFDVLHLTNGFIETNGAFGIAGLVFQLPLLPDGLSWEELDLNHRDLVLEVTGAAGTSPVPEPASLLLLCSGLLIGFGAKKYLRR
jgi:hypothetical protein